MSLTDAAASKLLELTKDETNPDVGLRVYVYSGGCSGYRYGMMLEDAPTPEENRLDVNGIKVYVDGESVGLLQGSQIALTLDTLHGRRVHGEQPRRGERLRLRDPASGPRRTRARHGPARTDATTPRQGHLGRRATGGFIDFGWLARLVPRSLPTEGSWATGCGPANLRAEHSCLIHDDLPKIPLWTATLPPERWRSSSVLARDGEHDRRALCTTSSAHRPWASALVATAVAP